MDHDRRYRFRPGAVGFTRGQLLAVVIGLAIALADIVALALRAWGPAGIMLGSAGVTISFTTLLAYANRAQPPT